MPVFTEKSSEDMKWRIPGTQLIQPISETDPILQSTTCKSTISSLLLSTFTNEPSSSSSSSTKKKLSFRGLGCTASASQQVSVPAVIRSSDDWKVEKVKKKKKKKNERENDTQELVCVDFQDVWCGPGVGFSAETDAGSVDCVVARRSASGRNKIDVDNHIRMNSHHHRERPCLARRTVSRDTVSFFDSEPEFILGRSGSEVFGSRYYRHVHHGSPEGYAEIMMFHSGLIMGGRSSMDRYREWRLDVDNMTYEQLLELGERIGYVNTGLTKDEIRRCVEKFELPKLKDKLQHGQCIICQEEYEADVADEKMGKALNCGHIFHFDCIEQWLVHKKVCPFCKVEATIKR